MLSKRNCTDKVGKKHEKENSHISHVPITIFFYKNVGLNILLLKIKVLFCHEEVPFLCPFTLPTKYVQTKNNNDDDKVECLYIVVYDTEE